MLRIFRPGNRDALVFSTGSVCIIIAVDQAFDFNFGWWGVLLWIGFGILYGNLCARRTA
jgi:hypothetical protein